jgi:hypothetical protein
VELTSGSPSGFVLVSNRIWHHTDVVSSIRLRANPAVDQRTATLVSLSIESTREDTCPNAVSIIGS